MTRPTTRRQFFQNSASVFAFAAIFNNGQAFAIGSEDLAEISQEIGIGTTAFRRMANGAIRPQFRFGAGIKGILIHEVWIAGDTPTSQDKETD